LIAMIVLGKIWVWGQGSLAWRWSYTEWGGIVVAASLAEEIVFRGFLLQKFMEITSFIKANSLVALLFAIIHFPVWTADGLTVEQFCGNAVYLLIFGYVLGYCFRSSQSLWTPVILHAMNNFLALITLSIYN